MLADIEAAVVLKRCRPGVCITLEMVPDRRRQNHMYRPCREVVSCANEGIDPEIKQASESASPAPNCIFSRDDICENSKGIVPEIEFAQKSGIFKAVSSARLDGSVPESRFFLKYRFWTWPVVSSQRTSAQSQ
jgi:hypothetical protein